MVKIKRVYEPYARTDGKRILVDRLWPRGIKKEDAHLNEWLKDVAPSNELRQWFGHDSARWKEFKARYIKELRSKPEVVKKLKEKAQKGTITLVFSAKDVKHDNAVVLKEVLSR